MEPAETESKKGAWLNEFFKHGNEKGSNNRDIVRSNTPTLQDNNITKDESAQVDIAEVLGIGIASVNRSIESFINGQMSKNEDFNPLLYNN